MKYLLLLLPLTLMMGCADSSTTGTNREYDIRVDISQNTGPVSLTFPLTVDATSATDQTTKGEASITPDINLQLVQPGATGSLSGADSTIKDTISKFQNILKRDAEKEAIEQLSTEPATETPAEPATETPSEPTETPSEPTATDDIRTETGTYHGRHNGDRPTWYFSKDFNQYPTPIIVNIPGCLANKLIDHNGIRYESGGLILKQSDVPGRHMAMVMSSSCQSEAATITY